MLEADGDRAKELLAAGESIGASTSDDGGDEEALMTGQVTIEVVDLSQGGLTATFNVTFSFSEEPEEGS